MRTILAKMTTTGPLAIASGEEGILTDRPVLRDQRSCPIIPGTSLAGALRAAASARYGAATAARLFGPERISGPGDARPSAVRVFDASFSGAEVPPTQVRDHVAIDRERGTARDGYRFDEETWPVGLPFTLELGVGSDDLVPFVLGTLDELTRPGRGVGAGPCPVRVEDIELHAAPSPEALVKAALDLHVGKGDVPLPRGERLELPPSAPPTELGPIAVEVRLTLQLTEPLAARVPVSTLTSDHDNDVFTVLVLDEKGKAHRSPALPGTSLLGVIRQRAERALHLAGVETSSPWETPAPSDHVAMTFGFEPQDGATADAAWGDRPGRPGVVHASDAVGEPSWFHDAESRAQDCVTTRQRVRIDRLTGSTHTTGKFEDTVVRDGTTLDVTLSIAPPDRPPTDLDVALVAVGLRDLAAGCVGVGGSSRSGYGTARIVSGTVIEHVRGVDGVEEREAELAPVDGTVGWPAGWVERLRAAWQEVTA